MLTDADIKRLLALGLTPDEIYCALDAPGPWMLSRTEA